MKLAEYLEGYRVYRQIKKTSIRIPSIKRYRSYVRSESPSVGLVYLNCGHEKAKKILPLKSAMRYEWIKGTRVEYDIVEFDHIMMNKNNESFREFFDGLLQLGLKSRAAYCFLHRETTQLIMDIYKNEMQYEIKNEKETRKILEYLIDETPGVHSQVLCSHKSIEQEAIRQRIAHELEFINQLKSK